MARKRHRRLVSILLTLAVLLVLLVPLSKPHALGVTLNLLIPEGNWRPLNLITPSPNITEATIDSPPGRSLTIRTFAPASRPRSTTKPPGLVIYTPLIGGGLDDPRLINLADTFARAGFIVAVPQAIDTTLAISAQDTNDVIATVHYLQREFSIDRIGLFGISYGTGPVFAAANDPNLQTSLAFLVSLNGFFDLANLIDFISTGHYSYQTISESREPHPYTQEVLGQTLTAFSLSGDDDLKTFLASSQFAQLRADLSPGQLLNDLAVPIYIIHSATDNFIPYTESLRLRDAVQPPATAELVVTDVIEHGTYRPVTAANLKRYYLPAAVNFHRLVVQLLSTAN